MHRPTSYSFVRKDQFNPSTNIHKGQRALNIWQKPGFHINRPSCGVINVNLEHWCETCDRGFPTFDLLDKHKGQHQKCNIDGCQFIAHPKVITKHIQMQHSTGLYKKIAKLNNPADIQKWIEERKKKYPTKCTIEKKSAEINEKIQRGEKMGLKHDRRSIQNKSGGGVKRRNEFHDKNYQNKNNFKRKKSYSNFTQTPSINPKVTQRSSKIVVLPADDKRKLQTFSGIQSLLAEICIEDDAHSLPESDKIEDDDFYEPSGPVFDNTSMNNKSGVCDALSSLMCSYISSDEENLSPQNKFNKSESEIKKNKEKTELIIINENTVETVKNKFSQLDELGPSINKDNKSEDDSGPEEVKLVKSNENVEIINSNNNNSGIPEKKYFKHRLEKKVLHKRPKTKLPSTLLTKLLYREMRQERNMILQCIRFIIKNNYFEDNKVE